MEEASAILLPPEPCSAPILAQPSLEVLLLTIPTPFSFLTALPAMYPRHNLPEGEMADYRCPFSYISRRNQQSSRNTTVVY